MSGKSLFQDKTTNELNLIAMIVLSGLVGIAIYSFQADRPVQGISIASSGLMFAGAALLIGGLIGFIFGIPRTLQQDRSGNNQKSTGTDVKEGADKAKTGYLANTNLEQISDWLTKILVGVGLTQLTVIPEKVINLSGLMSRSLGNFDSSQTFAFSILLYFLTCGFFYGYLWSRLFLVRAMRAADSELIGTLQVKVMQSEIDATALNLVYRQLDRSLDAPEVSLKELTDSIKESSQYVKAQIFYKSQALRANNWRDPKTKPIMERTIPIFRALAEADAERQYHQNHGQLGYALKDQRTPSYEEALRELTSAIEIRGDWRNNGWVLYEYNRAICKIMTDEPFSNNQPSKPDVKASILADLQAAINLQDAGEYFSQHPIDTWLQLNNVNRQELR